MMSWLYFAVTQIQPHKLPRLEGAPTDFQNILQIVFGIIGALALLIIVIAGFRYIVSAGDPERAARSKNTIVYALVGLIIAITAQGIIAFVLKRL